MILNMIMRSNFLPMHNGATFWRWYFCASFIRWYWFGFGCTFGLGFCWFIFYLTNSFISCADTICNDTYTDSISEYFDCNCALALCKSLYLLFICALLLINCFANIAIFVFDIHDVFVQCDLHGNYESVVIVAIACNCRTVHWLGEDLRHWVWSDQNCWDYHPFEEESASWLKAERVCLPSKMLAPFINIRTTLIAMQLVFWRKWKQEIKTRN